MQELGRITGLSGGLYTVETERDFVFCYAKGAFRKSGISPVVGDLVRILREDDGQKDKKNDGRGVICDVLPRKNRLIRPPLANLDALFILAAVKEPDPILLNVDKLLAIACHNGIRAYLVFTKKELAPQRAKELCSLYQNAGFSAFAVSREEGDEMREVLYPEMRQNSVCALAGASGVGKSTLINTLFPSLKARTGEISEKSGRGKHTTRESTLYRISSHLGCAEPVYVADTPGFSLLDFHRFFFLEKEDLPFAFPDFLPFLGTCKYTKCTHRTEEGCQILEQVKEGKIAESRHESYRALFQELNESKFWEAKKNKR